MGVGWGLGANSFKGVINKLSITRRLLPDKEIVLPPF